MKNRGWRDGGRQVRGTLGRLAGALLLLGAVGCVRAPQVQSKQLPVKKVVVYRNGVAYFERGGRVHSERVHFQLREENVGDFLATLAVLEKGGHSVKAASFPVKMESDEELPVDPELQRSLDRWDRKETDLREIRTVTLELDGDEHDLSVGYLAETPLWRPSYRLVVGEGGGAVLQAWGIVQNQSGEDWENVEIALVAGAPIAFQSTLGEPVVPQRPIVTDHGEVISSVPQGGTTLHHEEEAAMEEPAADMAMEEAMPEGKSVSRLAGSHRTMRNMAPSRYKKSAAPAAAMAPAPSSAPSPRMQARVAKVEVQSGATRYEVPHRVTIPDQSATMVLLVSKKVEGEAVFLFSPDHGVADSRVHPFRVARFKNQSGGLLERGPIAVFEKGAFLGQGMLESLPASARATVPFALVRSLTIRSDVSHDQRGARLYAIREGRLSIERDQATITTYNVKNGDKEQARVLLRHNRTQGAKLWDPPKGTEELRDQGAALIPVDVASFGKAKLTVEERRPIVREVDFQSSEARKAIRDYLKSESSLSSEVRTGLENVLKHAAQLSTIEDKERRLTREQRELERSTKETRSSLKAIRENSQASGLRAELTERLGKGTRRLDKLTTELVELRLRRTEQEIRLKEERQRLTIQAPDERKP